MSETNVLMHDGVPVLVSRESESLNERSAAYSAEEQKKLHIVYGVEEVD